MLAKYINMPFPQENDVYHSLASGRVNSLLYALLVDLEPGTIIFPSIMCASPIMTARFAGHQELCVDVDPITGLIDINSISETLETVLNVRAIVGVNLFGQSANYSEIKKLVSDRNILIIQDAAQGLDINNSAYSDVDATLCSFRSKKIIDLGFAIMVGKEELVNKAYCQLGKCQGQDARQQKELGGVFRDLYYNLLTLDNYKPGILKKYSLFSDAYKGLIFPDLPDNIDTLVTSLEGKYIEEVECRLYWSKKYYNFFSTFPDIQFCARSQQHVFWRFSILVPDYIRNYILSILRSYSVDVSSWYPSLSRLGFRTIDNIQVAKSFENQVINFWVDNMTEKKWEVFTSAFTEAWSIKGELSKNNHS